MKFALFILILCCLQTAKPAMKNVVTFHHNVPSNLYLNTGHNPTKLRDREGRTIGNNIIRLILYPTDKGSKSSKMASVVIESGQIQGHVGFVQFNPPLGSTYIHGTITGLNPGKYGINIHTLGDTRGGCHTIGEIYNPFTLSKDWQPYQRYMGEIGIIDADEYGNALIHIEDPFATLVGPSNIIGRALAITTLPDPENLQNVESGERIACGVIGYAS